MFFFCQNPDKHNVGYECLGPAVRQALHVMMILVIFADDLGQVGLLSSMVFTLISENHIGLKCMK